jgi:hypothetical protein
MPNNIKHNKSKLQITIDDFKKKKIIQDIKSSIINPKENIILSFEGLGSSKLKIKELLILLKKLQIDKKYKLFNLEELNAYLNIISSKARFNDHNEVYLIHKEATEFGLLIADDQFILNNIEQIINLNILGGDIIFFSKNINDCFIIEHDFYDLDGNYLAFGCYKIFCGGKYDFLCRHF